jgi:hypothetical protein
VEDLSLARFTRTPLQDKDFQDLSFARYTRSGRFIASLLNRIVDKRVLKRRNVCCKGVLLNIARDKSSTLSLDTLFSLLYVFLFSFTGYIRCRLLTIVSADMWHKDFTFTHGDMWHNGSKFSCGYMSCSDNDGVFSTDHQKIKEQGNPVVDDGGGMFIST